MKKAKWLAALAAGALLLGAAVMAGCSDGGGSGGGNPGGTKDTVVDGGQETGIPEPTIEGNYFPAKSATGVYEDASLIIKFDAVPTVNRDSGKTVKIYKGETLVDTIAPKAEKIKSIVSKAAADVLVDKQLISIQGNCVVVKLHPADSAKASILEAETEYSVVIEDGLVSGKVAGADFRGIAAGDWKFTTRAAKTIDTSAKAISVGKTGSEDFSTVQGAFNYMMTNNVTGDWTINIGEGYYNERLGYTGSANVKMVGANEGTVDSKVGQEGSAYIEKTVIHWKNMNGNDKSGYAWNPSSRGRAAFLYEGGNLTLENLTIANRIDRAVVGKGGTQAEALYYDATGYLVANNCAFKSHQDTLLLGNSGGRAWFYKSYIEGDTDFIWGYIDVALFEECEIRCLYDDAPDVTTHTSYIFASRTVQTHDANKGFVLFNSNVTVDDGVKAYYGRNSGSDTQATVVFNTFDKKVQDALWESGTNSIVDFDVSNVASIGYKDYGNKLADGTEISTAGRLEGTYTLSKEVAEREYCGRNAILNRGWKASGQKYAACETQWDLSAFETEYEASEDASKKMIYLEPTYVPYLEKDATQTFTASDYKGTAVAVSLESGDTGFATVSGSTVTALAKTDASGNKLSGLVTITATADGGMSGVAQIYVIPEIIQATGLTLDWGSEKTIEVGDIATVTATITPDDTTDKSITWTSSDTNVLRVEGSGPKKDGLSATVTGFGKGTATLTATVTKTNSVVASCTVTVKDVYFASYLAEGSFRATASVAHRDATIVANPLTVGFAGTTLKDSEAITWGNDGWNFSSAAEVDGKSGEDFFWAEFPIRAAGDIVIKSVSADLYTSATGNTRAMVYTKVGSGDYASQIENGIESTDKAMSLKKYKVGGDTGIEVAANTVATVKIAIASKSGKTLSKNVKCAIGNVVIYYEPKGAPIAFDGADGKYDVTDYHTGAIQQGTEIGEKTSADGMVNWKNFKYHGTQYKTQTSTGIITITVGGPSVIEVMSSQHSKGVMTVTNSSDEVIAGPVSTKTVGDTEAIPFLYNGEKGTIKVTFSVDTSYIGAVTVKELTSEKAELTSVTIDDPGVITAADGATLTAKAVATYCGVPTLKWSIKDAGTTGATINEDTGVFAATAAGKATVKVTATLGEQTKDDELEVTVSAYTVDAFSDPVVTIAKGATDTKTTTGSNTIVYESSDTTVATVVAATGVVTGVKGGYATITAYNSEDTAKSVKQTYVVEVQPDATDSYTWTGADAIKSGISVNGINAANGIFNTMLIDASAGKFQPRSGDMITIPGCKIYIPVDEENKAKTTITINLYKGAGNAGSFKLGDSGDSLTQTDFVITQSCADLNLVEKDGKKYVLFTADGTDNNHAYVLSFVRTVTQ